MDVILIPGFWLDASSWNEVTPALEAAGHRVHAVTLPGLESADAPRAGIGLDHHVEAVVRLGQSLGLDVVAEGIESPLQLSQLRELGCDRGQGYLFGRPRPASLVESERAGV